MKIFKMKYLFIFLVLLLSFIPSTYCKFIEKDTKHITINAVQPTYQVIFNGNGGTGSMANQNFTYKTAQMLNPNTYTNGTLIFDGWNTEANGSGTSYGDGESVNNLVSTNGGTITLYAQWTDKVARIGSTYYSTLAEAVAVANASSSPTTIVLIKNTYETISIDTGKEVTLNLNGKTLSYGNGNSNLPHNDNVIKNSGILTIKNGYVDCKAPTNGAINNNPGATLTFDNVHVTVTTGGNRQAFYNNGGTATLTGGSTFSSISTARCAVQNQSGSTLYVLDATIVSTAVCGIKNEGNLIVGNNNGSIVTSTPTIIGETNGIESNKNIKFYDGTLKGKSKAINNASYLATIPGGYVVTSDEEIIDGYTYQTKYLELGVSTFRAKIGTTEYTTLQEAIYAASGSGTTIIELIDDTAEEIEVENGKNVEIHLGSYTISNNGSVPVITNNGNLTLVGGTINTNAAQGAINQESGVLNIIDTEIIATGNRQTIYASGGVTNISGSTYLSSKTEGTPTGGTMERGTVQCLVGCTMNITGGTIVAIKQQAVSNEGTLTIGVLDGSIDTSDPVLMGKIYGVKSTGTFNFYDGIIKGETSAIDGTVSAKEPYSTIANGTDGNYQTAYLQSAGLMSSFSLFQGVVKKPTVILIPNTDIEKGLEQLQKEEEQAQQGEDDEGEEEELIEEEQNDQEEIEIEEQINEEKPEEQEEQNDQEEQQEQESEEQQEEEPPLSEEETPPLEQEEIPIEEGEETEGENENIGDTPEEEEDLAQIGDLLQVKPIYEPEEEQVVYEEIENDEIEYVSIEEKEEIKEEKEVLIEESEVNEEKESIEIEEPKEEIEPKEQDDSKEEKTEKPHDEEITTSIIDVEDVVIIEE